jgi:predicted nucleic-acid-binding protein
MQAVDTNVLVRFLTQDDAAQAARATALIKRQEVWIAKTVLLETAWVLRSLYAFDQARIVAALRSLAGLENARLEDSGSIARAFELADAGLDFADALHLVSMGAAESFVTFDRKFASRARKLASVVTL